MAKKLTACIITFEEEDNIANCLNSLRLADEIVLVDSGSSDNTRKIASEMGAKVIIREFDNYINQKNYALSEASHEWILALDADEILSNSLQSEIRDWKAASNEDFSAFEFPRITFYLGKWIRHSGWYPNYQTRLFKAKQGKFTGSLVHETVDVAGRKGRFHSPILHYSYKDISDHLKFIDRYSSLAAQEKYNSGEKSSVIWSILKGLVKSFWMYFGRLGFLDGKAGVVLAILGFYYNFLKYIKLYEIQKSQKEKNKSNLSFPYYD